MVGVPPLKAILSSEAWEPLSRGMGAGYSIGPKRLRPWSDSLPPMSYS